MSPHSRLSNLYSPSWNDSLYSIETRSLTKVYGSGLAAVDNISFQVNEGEIFGFLGPNGAGKSTAIMILTTLLKPTSGNAYVTGYDVVSQAKKVRENIGYVQQDITVDEYLTGRENLLLQARLNHIPKNLIENRITELLELIELKDRQDEAVITYSGGMRKRLEIAGGLLHRPKVLFLDEPTVGLDIQTRQKIWEYIKKIHNEFKMTIFLTTHYMEEADRLCDRIGIIDYGKIQAVDKPQTMKNSLGNEVIVFSIDDQFKKDTMINTLKETEFVKEVTAKDDKITIFSSKGAEIATILFNLSSTLGIQIKSISITQPSLDDVFLSYTGRELRDEATKNYNRKKEYTKMKMLRQ